MSELFHQHRPPANLLIKDAHVLDPRTCRPAETVWRTVSVCAYSCVDANIVTTAALIRGPRAVPWIESLRLPARLVTAAGEVLQLGGWPEAGEK